MIFSLDTKIHFIGIGGSGMSPIANYLVDLGHRVTGSDVQSTTVSRLLEKKGVTIQYGHDETALVSDADIVVHSSAISMPNKELVVAKSKKKNVFRRAMMLNQLFKTASSRISVSGTHGKTTTSGLISHILMKANREPSFVIGSKLVADDISYRCGESSFFVIEADESDGSFLDFNTNALILLNLEQDHMSFFKTKETLHSYFQRMIDQTLDNNGTIYVNADDKALMSLIPSYGRSQFLYYGIQSTGVTATDITFDVSGVSFTVTKEGNCLGTISMMMLGMHNVYNALAAITCLLDHGLSFDEIKQGIASFQGTSRRMSCVGVKSDIAIYDDYAHHPTEVVSTLKGVKAGLNRRVICVFQPHRYTRLRDFFTQFSIAFSSADVVIVTDVYASGELPIEGVSSMDLAKAVQTSHSGIVKHVQRLSEVPTTVQSLLKPDDVVVFMGAGDIFNVSKDLFLQLK